MGYPFKVKTLMRRKHKKKLNLEILACALLSSTKLSNRHISRNVRLSPTTVGRLRARLAESKCFAPNLHTVTPGRDRVLDIEFEMEIVNVITSRGLMFAPMSLQEIAEFVPIYALFCDRKIPEEWIKNGRASKEWMRMYTIFAQRYSI